MNRGLRSSRRLVFLALLGLWVGVLVNPPGAPQVQAASLPSYNDPTFLPLVLGDGTGPPSGAEPLGVPI